MALDHPTDLPETEALTGSRRSFIKGIAAAGASTAAAAVIDTAGVLDLFSEDALAQAPNDFSRFTAIAPSAADAFEVPPGYRADVVIKYGDTFAGADGELVFGYNNDYLAFFPLPAGSNNSNEGLVFINHEYPGPFLQHGQTNPRAKTVGEIELERGSVGNAIVHIKRDADGVFRVVSPSPYNRRITGRDPECEMTGPLAGNPAYPGVGTTARGSLANCSGGITPWGTALSCEENYQDYGALSGFGYGWVGPAVATMATDPATPKLDTDDYYNGDGTAAVPPKPGPNYQPSASDPDTLKGPAKYGWVVETDPYDPSFQPRKHTALGRFRHENTAFRALPNAPFVLYMGDDVRNGAVYKFVSDLPFRPGRRAENLRILESGTLYIARWTPEGRRRFASPASTTPLTATSGAGTWREVTEDELVDTQRIIRAKLGATEFDTHYATNRPEDVEVDEDGTVWIALTNNSTVNDTHGSIRLLKEAGNDPAATSFTWEDFAAGGPSGRQAPGESGFSSPDNLVFDKAGNVWVVTDISSSSLNDASRPEAYHANNAVFMIPRSGPNKGVAYRFANMPIQAEGTGPYFTPDERTLFVNVQHPGEESSAAAGNTSFWPGGNKTTGANPQKPIPAMVAVTKLSPRAADTGTNVIPPPAAPAPAADRALPEVALLSPGRQRLSTLRSSGLAFRLSVDEPVTVVATLRGRLTSRSGGRGKERRIARSTFRFDMAGTYTIRLRPATALRVLLRRERALPAALLISARDRAGNVRTRRKQVEFR